MWKLETVPTAEDDVAETASEYRTVCLQEITRGRCLPPGETTGQRLKVTPRPPDVRWVASGPPPGNYHDWTRPMVRADSGQICDYQRGDWRTGTIDDSSAPRLLPPNHEMLGVPGGLRVKEVEPALTALERAVFDFTSEDPQRVPQGRVPLLIIKQANPHKGKKKVKGEKRPPPVRRPVIIFCHDVGKSKEEMVPRMEAAARRGYVAAAIDARYHGGRAESPYALKNALVQAWKAGAHAAPGPAVYGLDTVWDLIALLDLLELMPDVDAGHIGATGIGLGGLHAWLLMAADARCSAGAPLMGVQNFQWSLANDMWQEYLGSSRSIGYMGLALPTAGQNQVLQQVADMAKNDAREQEMSATTATELYNRLMPGLLGLMDAPNSLAMCAPRPLIIVSGDLDETCPIEGVEEAVEVAAQWYAAAGAPHALQLKSFDNVLDIATPEMHIAVDDWLDQWLLYGGEDADAARERLAPAPPPDPHLAPDLANEQQLGTVDEAAVREARNKALADAYKVSGEWID